MLDTSLQTLAVIYESGNESVFKGVLDKLMLDSQIFVFIQIEPKQVGSYSFTDSQMSQMMKQKLDAAQKLYIINPKGKITRYIHNFLRYGEETGKPVHYMYKFCYKDCKYRKAKGCALTKEMYYIPDGFKLLPACESYSRIYDDWFMKTDQVGAGDLPDMSDTAGNLPDNEENPASTEAVEPATASVQQAESVPGDSGNGKAKEGQPEAVEVAG